MQPCFHCKASAFGQNAKRRAGKEGPTAIVCRTGPHDTFEALDLLLLRRLGTAVYLQEVGDGEVDVPLALPVEELGALHHHQVRGEVDPPRQGGRADEHLQGQPERDINRKPHGQRNGQAKTV